MTSAKSGGERFEPEIDPESAAPAGLEALAHLIHRSSELLRDGKAHDAEQTLERALRRFPHNPAARHLLALSWLRSGQLERALALYVEMLSERPDSIAAKVNVAVVLLKLGRASSARPLLEEVVRARPDHRRAWGYLGATLEQLGYVADAESAFVAGHFATAAKRLRDRHADVFASGAIPSDGPNGEGAMPAFPRRTVALEPRGSSTAGVGPGFLAYEPLPRFTATLRPPSLAQAEAEAEAEVEATDTGVPLQPPAQADAQRAATPGAATPGGATPGGAHDDLQEIAFEETVTQLRAMPPPSITGAPKPSRPVVPLLDAALSSLLVVPQEAEVVAHATGLVIAGLAAREGVAGEGGFAARKDVVHAFAGGLRREALPRRPAPSPEPFRASPSPFVRMVGTGQLILAPPRGSRLLPLQMDADVAFVREELVVAFDHGLLCDLGRLGRRAFEVSLVRFRGDGVIVLALDAPFLAFDVRAGDTLTLRGATLVGWVGSLTPDPVPGDEELVTFDGEGTVLFLAPNPP